jgi:predicted ATPase
LPSGTVTFLFTDVEGSTKLLHELGAAGYAEALAEHRRLIREACAAEGGVEVDTQGDAFFFAFPTAPRALAAASAFTDSLAVGPIQVRVGLHTGNPLVTDEGYIGDDVHFGARVASSSHGGQVILSATTAAQIEPSYKLSLVDLGEHRLKDIPKAVPIYQLGDGAFPPLKTISNTNLPRPASSFVGRERETGEVVALLRNSARLVTLSGSGGSGKTRLSIEAASELVPDFKAGVFWVGLATLRDPALVTETIAQTLGAKDGLAEHIADREMLLLLDNLEQVIDSAPELGALLEACPNLKLLVTSRERLRIRGEVEYAVPPLSEPEAVSLFCERSQLAADEMIAELCRRLDNLPLAVELAAARTSVLTPEQILERLSQRLDLLTGGRDSEARQQTLRATIEWSFDLLLPEEQQLFARLSVFAGGCTLEAAQEVADADIDTLQSLVDKSLLRFTDGRYWMLETIREYAGELRGGLGLEETDQRHANWGRELSRRAERELEDGDTLDWLERLDQEIHNIRATLTWFADQELLSTQLEVAASLWRYWLARALFDEAKSLVNRALEAEPPPELRAKGLRLVSWIAYQQGEFAAASRLAGERLQVALRIGDDTEVQGALTLQAYIARGHGDLARARELHEQILDAAVRIGEVNGRARALTQLADCLVDQGEYEDALPLVDEALRIAGDGPGRSFMLGVLGEALARSGQTDAGRRALVEALQLDRVSLSERDMGIGLEPLALTFVEESPRRAARYLAAIDAAFERIGATRTSEEAERHDGAVAALRSVLGEEFGTAWREGQALELADAVDEALASID